MLNNFGVWYISWGYLFMTALAAPVGFYAASAGKPKYLISFILACFIVGALAIYGKYFTLNN